MRSSFSHPKHDFEDVCARNQANICMRYTINRPKTNTLFLVKVQYKSVVALILIVSNSQSQNIAPKNGDAYRGMSHY